MNTHIRLEGLIITHLVEWSEELTIYLFLEVGQFAPAENDSHHVLFKVCVRWCLLIKSKQLG